MGRVWLLVGSLALLAGCASTPASLDPLDVRAAAGLKAALGEIATEHQAETGQVVSLTFGLPGPTEDRMPADGRGAVFVSDDTRLPRLLAQTGQWTPHVVLGRGRLCGLTRSDFPSSIDSLTDVLLDPLVRLGTFNRRVDPQGLAAAELFLRINAMRPGAHDLLESKSLMVQSERSPGSNSDGPPLPAALVADRQVDFLLVFCSDALAAQRQLTGLRVVELPNELRVSVPFAFSVRRNGEPAARLFVERLMAPRSQATFARYGFSPP